MDIQTAALHEIQPAEDPRLFEIRRQARLELARQAAAEKDILLWGKAVFPYKFELPYCHELHGYFVKIRSDEFTNTKAPRNHAKTAIKCFLIPTFQAIYEPGSFRHYLNVQATKEKALAINTSIKFEFETNHELRELIGEDPIGEKWTDSQFVLWNGIVFTAIGAGQSIRGINYHQLRPDWIGADDLYDEEDINNPESTEKKNEWFWGSLYPARARGRHCSVHVQGTAINQHDLMTKLENDPTVKSRVFKAVKDWDRKVVLWPELNSFEKLQIDLARMGSHIFMREMQNEPRDDKTAIIKHSWLYKKDGRSWEYDPQQLTAQLKDISTKVRLSLTAVRIGNDPSIGKDSENDDTGTALVLETQWSDGSGKDYWIEDIRGEQLSLEGRIRQLVEIARDRPKDRPVTIVSIEAIAGFDDYASEVIRRTNLPVKRISFVKDKITNLENKSHYFENGKVHLNRNIEQALKDKLVYQLTTNHPQHDDIRDAVLLTLDDQSGLWNFVG